MSDISNQLIKDSYNYVLQSDLNTGIVYRIGGGVPVNPIFQSGLTISSGFTFNNGTEQPGYVLTSDSFGNANWEQLDPSLYEFLPLSGGTVTGDTTFTQNLFVSTISATTYQNLPSGLTCDGLSGCTIIQEIEQDILDIENNYVPYTGATRDVDLGVYSLKADSLEVSTNSIETIDVGKIVWNSADGTFDMGLLNGVTLQAGQEIHLYGKADGEISNGDAVQFAGSQGDHLLIKKAVPSEINLYPEYFIGIATQNFANNDFGYVTVFGQVRDLDTSMYSGGTVLYFQSSGTTPGLLTDVRPTGPRAKITVAAVVRSHQNQGAIFVRPHVMPMIGDLQNVEISGATNGQILTYDEVQQVWTNIDLPSSIDGGGTINYIPKFTGSTSLGDSQIFDNGTNVGIGTTNPQYTLDVSGAVRLGTQTATPHLVFNRNSNNYITTPVGGTILFNLSNVANESGSIVGMYSNGVRVGNGFSNPSAVMHVRGAGSTSATNAVIIQNSAPSSLLQIKNDGTTEFSGNVGIGVTPTSKLDVRGNTYDSVVCNVSGTEGTLFQVLDNLSGNLLEVNDISGIDIFSVNSSGYTQHISNREFAITGNTIVYQFPTSVGEVFKMMYSVKDGVNLRGGEYLCVQDGTNVNNVHTFPTEFGNTSGVSFTFTISSGNIIVTAVVTSGSWNIKLNVEIL